MFDLQILNRIIKDKNFSIVLNHSLGAEHFSEYFDEFMFIKKHFDKYGKVPDKETLVNKFPDFKFLNVEEPDSFLVEGVREEAIYPEVVKVINEAAKLVSENANKAAEYALPAFKALLEKTPSGCVDIIKNARERLKKLDEDNKRLFIPSGFAEIDVVTGGIQRGEELITVFGRTNQGKSWVLQKMAASAFEAGFNVGYYSGEMSCTKVGYRIDTILKHFSNVQLVRKNLANRDDYEKYVTSLENKKVKIVVATPKELGGKATVSKLTALVAKEKLDILFVDQLSLMKDETAERGTHKKDQFGNITAQLFDWSEISGVPVVIAAQANRMAMDDEDQIPDLHHIAESDQIPQNSSKVLAIRQKDDALELCIRKNRDYRVGAKFLYNWQIDSGLFAFIDVNAAYKPPQEINNGIRKPKDKDVF